MTYRFLPIISFLFLSAPCFTMQKQTSVVGIIAETNKLIELYKTHQQNSSKLTIPPLHGQKAIYKYQSNKCALLSHIYGNMHQLTLILSHHASSYPVYKDIDRLVNAVEALHSTK